MKKRFVTVVVLVITALLMLALAACGEDSSKKNNDEPLTRDDGKSTTAPYTGETPNIDFGSIIANKGTSDATIWGYEDEAVKQAIINQARADGYNVSFGADGSMIITEEDGSKLIQKTDGTWTFEDADGSTSQLGGKWPDNEYTKLIPNPGFTLTGASSTDSDFTAVFQDVTAEQAKAYGAKVKDKGFTIDAEEENQNAAGIEIYRYTAKNASEYTITLAYANGVFSINIYK